VKIARLLRFVLVGLISTGTYFVLTEGLVLTGQPIDIAHLIGYPVSLVVSYIGRKVFTFGVRGQHRRSGPRFLIATAILAATQWGLIQALKSAGLGSTSIVVISAVYYPVASFFLHTLWTFRAPPAPAGSKPAP